MNHHSFLASSLFFTCAISALSAPVQPTISPEQAVLNLIARVTPDYARRVDIQIRPEQPLPILSGQEGKLLITANSTRECIRAYGYYLRKIAHIHLSWNGDNLIGAEFSLPSQPIQVPQALPMNYALNYCTLSYSCIHWDKIRWEKELDRFALNGYTHILVTSGLEKVWQQFLGKLGYPRNKVASFIPHPVYSAWWNMGNLEGAGGPISQETIDEEARLGHFLTTRIRELGMEPVLQGYVGFLPHDFDSKSLKGTIIPQGKWCGYVRPSILQPTSEGFPAVAALWYRCLKQVYGITANAFCGDLFHEGGNKGNTNLGEAARAIQQAMQKAAPRSLWFLQAWGGNPAPQLLEGTQREYTTILALDKNLSAGHSTSRQYQGRPYVWCELANFGGNHGLYGGIPLLERLSGNAEGASGLGMISEGIETNPLYYAFLTERINNREEIDENAFLHEYTRARYGADLLDIRQALQLLVHSVYAPQGVREGCLENLMCARPWLKARKVSTWADPTLYYDPASVEQAAQLMLKAGQEHPELQQLSTYQYDLVDFCRQVLADRARKQLERCQQAYEAHQLADFRRESSTFLQLIHDTAAILECSRDFLLGTYLKGADKRAANKQEKGKMMINIKRLITTWKPDISSLNDYAHRQLSELMEQYYLKRWSVYFATCEKELRQSSSASRQVVDLGTNDNNGETVSASYQANERVDTIEQAFAAAPLKLKTSPAPPEQMMQRAERILRSLPAKGHS